MQTREIKRFILVIWCVSCVQEYGHTELRKQKGIHKRNKNERIFS